MSRPEPDRYAVFGNPIDHSRSPAIHAAFADLTGQHITYEKLLAPRDSFAAAVAQFIASGGRGANVTVPFKLEAHALAQTLTPRAAAAGAVNTLCFGADGTISGDNTDGVGLVRDLRVNAGVAIGGRRILLLGAGGAARGVLLPLLAERPAQLVVANRSAAKATELVAAFQQYRGNTELVASNLGDLTAGFDVVINATSASLDGSVPAVSAAIFAPGALAYDMMYAATPTAFLALAQGHGATVRDGLGMLVEQAAEAFFVWRGVRPPTATVLADLRASL